MAISSFFSYQGLPSWQVGIIKEYPRIYIEPDPRQIDDMRERRYNPYARYYCNLRLGFECQSGWEKLIYKLSSIAEGLCVDLRSSSRPT